MVCHDNHNDYQTRVRLYPELHLHGGWILQVHGDNSQDLHGALGKILVHREEWRRFFAANRGGRMVLGRDRVTPQPAINLYERVQGALALEKATPRTTKARPKKPQPNRASEKLI